MVSQPAKSYHSCHGNADKDTIWCATTLPEDHLRTVLFRDPSIYRDTKALNRAVQHWPPVDGTSRATSRSRSTNGVTMCTHKGRKLPCAPPLPNSPNQILSIARRYFLITSSNSPSEKGSFATARWCRHLENCSKLEPLPPSYLLCVRGVGTTTSHALFEIIVRMRTTSKWVWLVASDELELEREWMDNTLNTQCIFHGDEMMKWDASYTNFRAEPVLTTESLQSLRLTSVARCYTAHIQQNFNIQVWRQKVCCMIIGCVWHTCWVCFVDACIR